MEPYDWDSLLLYGDIESPWSILTKCDDLVSVSTTFSFTAQHRPQPADVVLLSKDSVRFYVHSGLLLDASNNGFRTMLPISPAALSDEPPILNVPEFSPVLNVILHVIYGMYCAHSPPFETLVDAVNSMPAYGITPKSTILPSTPLFSLLLSHAPLVPLHLYALAAHYDIFDLAVPTSSHLLGFPLSRLTDEVVERMGPTYLKRLFFLHFGRAEALKRVLGSPPHPHPPTLTCDFKAQKGLSRAWTLATAYLTWDVRPGGFHICCSDMSDIIDISAGALESALRPLGEHLSCDLCKDALNDRVKTLIVQWSMIKRTI
ncbi:hypothetical protein B0H19DRAFT_1121622 [Mycena capillaripes]|nr:hypothetical protein B0H19DRAFT_1121622 [Mycena capillaripes]